MTSNLPFEISSKIFGELTKPPIYNCLLVNKCWNKTASIKYNEYFVLTPTKVNKLKNTPPHDKWSNHLVHAYATNKLYTFQLSHRGQVLDQ